MFTLLLLFFTNAWGQVGAAADALGGASLANPHAIESAWTNPAGLAMMTGTFADIQYFNGNVDTQTVGTVTTNTELRQYSATITDGGGGAFPGSLGYRQRTYEIGGDRVHERVIRFAAAIGLYPELVLGLAGYRVHTDPSWADKTDQDNADISLMYQLTPSLRFGAISRAVLGAKDNMYGPSRVMPSGGLGVRYNLGAALGVLADFTYGYEGNGTGQRLQSQVGLEYLHFSGLAFRAGYNDDDWRGETRVTGGVGWDGPKLRVGYSYQKETRREMGVSHTVDIWMAF
jgi:hypothetical protein